MFKFLWSIFKRRKKKPYKLVGILEPRVGSSVEDIRDGFMQELSKKGEFECIFKIYNAQGDRFLLHEKLKHIAQDNLDVVCSVGAECTNAITTMRIAEHVPLIPVSLRNDVPLREDNCAPAYIKRVRPKRIALVSPSTSFICRKIKSGLLSRLAKERSLDCEVSVINGNGSIFELKNIVDEKFEQHAYDLVFSIGNMATHVTKEYMVKKRAYAPVVFGAVSDTILTSLKESPISSLATGIFAQPLKCEEQVNALLSLMPGLIKKVAIVYGSSDLPFDERVNQQEASEFKAFLKRSNVDATILNFFTPTDIYGMAGFLSDVDVMIVLRTDRAINNIQHLVAVSTEYNILLYTSDAETVKRGACLGFGDFDYASGEAMAERGLSLLIDQMAPFEIPIVPIQWSNKLFVNPYVASLQKRSFNFKDSLYKNVAVCEEDA